MTTLSNTHKIAAIALAAAVLIVLTADLPSRAADSDKENSMVLKVATCQLPVSKDIRKNAEYIKKFIKEAAENKADIVHFSEAALSGYGGSDFPSFENFDWQTLRAETHQIMALAKKLNIWVILGSAHYISENEKPTNCLYIISNEGKIVDRYDKSMLTTGDLKVYTPGNHLVTITLKGIKCGFLICYDICYPEMYNIYRHKGIKLMFHSFYNAHHKGKTILDEIGPAWIRVRATDYRMWVVASNSAGRHSSWPTSIGRPDGSLVALKRHVPGILYREFPDTEVTDQFRSWTHNNKMMALPKDEVYHNGKPSNHPRAVDTKSLP
ncbi:MAG: carbon-nitrogen hydrolase family protein [Planctomycetota bacterium]|jgi:predicted amidohydrolase